MCVYMFVAGVKHLKSYLKTKISARNKTKKIIINDDDGDDDDDDGLFAH